MKPKLTNSMKWNKVWEVFDLGAKCQKCDFCRMSSQRHEWGSTHVTEHLRMCRVIDESKYSPEDCPGIQQYLEEEEYE
jgi:hypothetical protein